MLLFGRGDPKISEPMQLLICAQGSGLNRTLHSVSTDCDCRCG